MTLANWQQQLIQGIQTQTTFIQTHDCHPVNNLKARLSAYDDNYQLGLQAWLKKAYQQVVQLIGDAYFYQLVADFIQQHPLTAQNLFDYGYDFIGFLQTHQILEQLPYLADVAKVDWLIQQSYYAKPRMMFDVQAFSQLNQETQANIRFVLAPDVTLLCSVFPLDKIWQIHQTDTDIKTLPINQEQNLPCHYSVSRTNYKASIEPISAITWQLYQAIQNNNTLSMLINISPDFSNVINEWIQKKWIVGFVTGLP